MVSIGVTAGGSGRGRELEGVPRLAGRSTAWWGMLWGLAALASLLSTLLFSFFYLAALAPEWPPAGIPLPGLLLPSLATAILVLSVGPAALLHTSVRADDVRRLLAGVAATVVLGTVAVALIAIDLARADFTPQTHAFGSAYFGVTWFQVLTAVAGLALLAGIPFHTWNGGLHPRLQTMAVVTAVFWYYVAGGWLAVYATLHLAPRLW